MWLGRSPLVGPAPPSDERISQEEHESRIEENCGDYGATHFKKMAEMMKNQIEKAAEAFAINIRVHPVPKKDRGNGYHMKAMQQKVLPHAESKC